MEFVRVKKATREKGCAAIDGKREVIKVLSFYKGSYSEGLVLKSQSKNMKKKHQGLV